MGMSLGVNRAGHAGVAPKHNRRSTFQKSQRQGQNDILKKKQVAFQHSYSLLSLSEVEVNTFQAIPQSARSRNIPTQSCCLFQSVDKTYVATSRKVSYEKLVVVFAVDIEYEEREGKPK
jgi:hypothetical protein